MLRLMIKIQNSIDSGNKATKPLVKKPKNNIRPDNERYKNRLESRLFKINNMDKLVNIIIVFSSILFAADHVTTGIETHNASGSHANECKLIFVIFFQIPVIIHPVIINVINE